jgi:ABC-type branched-subunit amino acid transport system permease subunit
MPVAALLAAAVGLAVGPFALRLKGLYLAIVTLGLVFLVAHVLRSFPERDRRAVGDLRTDAVVVRRSDA